MLVLKGIIIGLGKIIPGVSGSMLAITLGLYEKLVNSINNFFKDIKGNFKFLFKVGIGVMISVVFFSKLIVSALSYSYIATIFLFMGLIIGSIGDIKVNIKKKDLPVSILIFILILLFGLLNINNSFNISNGFLKFIFYVFAGYVDAVTMVIPGISGTATLMMIGAYDSVIESLSNLTNISLFFENLKVLFPFSIGMIIGVILTAKLVDYLFKHYKSLTFSAILGFTFSTIVLMGIKCFNSTYTLKELLISIILLIAGVFVTKKISNLN